MKTNKTPTSIRYEMQRNLSEYYYNNKSDAYMLKKVAEYDKKGYCADEFLGCYFSYKEEKREYQV